ncbi:K02A2.6-like [Cordylochernes scorpioides]|uniref:RNA-directed DNA polymerase n=1 Tax=Cordylochernes scorpioides TaxID=51811 RepID=A0ABY6JYI1_9ARAC|nr:K02A2.6-like [Cordylochernes scorpioides]
MSLFTIEKFDETTESWERYTERLEYFFEANNIDQNKKKAIFLTLLTPTVYNLLYDLCIPKKLSDVENTYPVLVSKLKNHFNPTPSAIVERSKFSNRARRPGEKISIYIAELKKMAEYCKFGSTIDEAIRDRLIAGIEDDNIQRKLLGEGDSLTLHRAIEIALALEAAAQDANDLQSQRNPEVVMKIKQGNWRLKPSTTGKFTRSESYTCIRCGSKDHKQDKCPHLKAKCFNCGKIGHLGRSCLKRKPQRNYTANKDGNKVHAIAETEISSQIFKIVNLWRTTDPIKIEVQINDKILSFEYDTGSAYSLISESTRRFFGLPNPCPADPLRVKLATYSGQPLPVLEPVEMVLLMDASDSSPVTSDDIRASLPGDPALRQALNYTLQGWSEETPKEIELMPYWSRRCELGACEGLLFWGNRVIIPTNLRAKMLDELHNSHQGIVGLKSVARTLFWWPGLDKDIEETVRRCNCCQSLACMPPQTTPVNWPPTNQPWDRVHIDHLGPFEQNLYLIVVDACTKDTKGNRTHFYWSRRCELGACEGLLFWGNRVIIPTNLRAKMLDELHNSHQGIVGLKSVARTLFWWPGLDKDIEETVRRCNCCQSLACMPPRTTPVNWPPTNQPWDRVHIDHLGPFEQNLYLIVVDACTKWIEAIPVPNTSTRETIEQLRCLFARFGIPRTLVSDNGTGFTSEEFRQFMTRNGIRHLRTAPFHPSSNGLAERAVQTIKTGLKKVQQGSISQRLAEILLGYRRTPIASIGKSPSEMMFGRNIRSRLDLILPNPGKSEEPGFKVGESVWYRTYKSEPKWDQASIQNTTGNRLVTLQTARGQARRHWDQVRRSHIPDKRGEATEDHAGVSEPDLNTESEELIPQHQEVTSEPQSSTEPAQSPRTSTPPDPKSPPVIPLRRSSRIRRPPTRLNL